MRRKEGLNFMDSYKFYKSVVDNPVKYNIYIAVVKKMMEKVIDKLYNSHIISLPVIGELYVKKKQIKYKFTEDGKIDHSRCTHLIDYGATNKLWAKRPDLKEKKVHVYYENRHTNGYKFSLKWRKNIKIRHLVVYNLTPARGFKRGLAVHIKTTKNIDYYD